MPPVFIKPTLLDQIPMRRNHHHPKATEPTMMLRWNPLWLSQEGLLQEEGQEKM